VLLLQNGVWEDAQIVPGTWLQEATSTQITTPFGLEYGYLFWRKSVNACDSYMAWGLVGSLSL
jgi:CubicO group peptidase (beta-lactamase class C family)